MPEKIVRVKIRNGFVKVSECDRELAKSLKWYVNSAGYAQWDGRFIDDKRQRILMHRLIMNPPEGKWIDHINGKKLDNRRSNLRIITPLQNNHNRAKVSSYGFKGVMAKPSGRWGARITFNGKSHYLGTFDTKLEAAMAYDKMAKKRFGSFAKLNFPEASI